MDNDLQPLASGMHASIGNPTEATPDSCNVSARKISDPLKHWESQPTKVLQFTDLPTEVRLQIYRAAIGDRLIHIQAKFSRYPSIPVRLTHYICHSQLSEVAIYDQFSQPVVFKNRID